MHKSVTSKKQLWQWSSEGRDFCEIPSDKDTQNMRIKILFNLEQCTEDHDNERIYRNIIADNRDLYNSENEETEYKILLDNMPKNACTKNTMVSDYCEKKDDEKEENESKAEQKNSWKCEEMKKDEEKPDSTVIVNHDNDKMEKFEAECLVKKEERKLESDDIGDGLHAMQHARWHSRENIVGLNKDKRNEDKKKYSTLMLDEGKCEAEVGDQLNQVVTESGFYEDLESFRLGNTSEVEMVEIITKKDLIQRCSVVPDEEKSGFCSEFENLTDEGKVSSSEECELINSKQSISEVGNFIVTESDLSELLELSENQEDEEKNTRNPDVTNATDEKVKHQFRSSVYSSEDLVMLKSECLSFTFPVVCCSNTDWYEKQEMNWKNISNFSGPEIQNCVHCHGGNGSNKGNSSDGNGENSNSTSDHQSGCTSLANCSSNCTGGGGCAGGSGSGGDDGDKWKKESFCHSDVNDERKTKQTKEMKKKSRLEMADLTGSHNSDPLVCYASEEDLREMSTKWQERAENLRKNAAAQSFSESCQNEGIVLNQYKAKFLITGNSYSADQEWFIVTDDSLGIKHGSSAATDDVRYIKRGTSGKCYPCIDINTEAKFCIKQISLCDFYASEIIILMELDHPGVVKLYGAIFTEDTVFIMMELITGPTLQEYIMQESKLDCPSALRYTKELLEVLAYFHKEGIIHDDIKDNIMLRNGSIVMIDFGLAKRKPSVEAGAVPVGNQCGMSPEKATSSGYDTRADVWAAIAVLVHMISGSMPWSRRFKQKAMLHLIIAERSPPLEDVPVDVPPEVRSLIESGWTVDGKKRPFAHDILSHAAFQYSSEHCQDNPDNDETDSGEDLIVDLGEGDMLLEKAELILASSERNVNN